jgi:hypothetical protein
MSQENVYTKEEVDDFVNQLEGDVRTVTGTMTPISSGDSNNPSYIAYVTMDPSIARKVIQISYRWEGENTGIIFGNNLSYYEELTFGNTTLTNVWCTPTQVTEP